MSPDQVVDIVSVILNILSVTGGAAWLAAIPQVQKVVQYIPLVGKVVNLFAANVGAAKNRL